MNKLAYKSMKKMSMEKEAFNPLHLLWAIPAAATTGAGVYSAFSKPEPPKEKTFLEKVQDFAATYGPQVLKTVQAFTQQPGQMGYMPGGYQQQGYPQMSQQPAFREDMPIGPQMGMIPQQFMPQELNYYMPSQDMYSLSALSQQQQQPDYGDRSLYNPYETV